jgi:hypothetical protein
MELEHARDVMVTEAVASLSHSDGAMVNAVANELGIDQSGASRFITQAVRRGYLRKEAAASTVVERLREVLRPRARVEQRVASGGEVRGRLDGLTPRLVLELACRAQRPVRVSIRDSSYLYEVQIRDSAPRTAIRSANDGSFERGESVLSMLLGVSAGRFVIEPDESSCRAELSGSLHEQLAAPVARIEVRKTAAFTCSSGESWATGMLSSAASVRVQYASRACCDAASTRGR